MPDKNKAYLHIKTLHKVVTSHYESIDDLLDSYIQAGCEIFELELGIVSRIEKDSYTVLSVSKNLFGIERGAVFELKDTYCREVFNNQETLAVHHAAVTEPLKSHPAYQNLKLESYISSPIFVHGKLYGTINFSSTKARKAPFENFENELNELMAESVGRFVEYKLSKELSEKQEDHMYTMSKLSTLGEMAGGIAHEINNPLAIISASSSVAQMIITEQIEDPDPELLHSLETIEKTVKRISKIIGGMKMLMGKENSQEFDRQNISEIVETTLSFSKERLKKRGIRLTTLVDADQSTKCFPSQISQVVTNLLSNAVDAVQGSENPWIRVELLTIGDLIQLKVADSGRGIPTEHQAKIFEPFFTTKGTSKGTGLGLSISAKIADHHNGRLYIDDTTKNTCFIFELPILLGTQKEAS